MHDPRRILMLAVFLIGAAPLAAPSDNLEAQRRYVERLRAEPDRYAQVLRDLEHFNSMSASERNRIRQLDRDLQEETSASQARLLHAGQRYADWFARLSPDLQAKIRSAPDKDKRLQLIKEIREQEWIEGLPSAESERIRQATGNERRRLIDQQRGEESRKNRDWQLAISQWSDISTLGVPDNLDRFPADKFPKLREFVEKSLAPRLSAEELARLNNTKGQWPLFPRTLVKLADDNAFKLILPLTGPSKMEDLPNELQQQLSRVKVPEAKRKQLTGKWPDFAEFITGIAHKHKIPMPQQLGPCVAKDFPEPTRDFIRRNFILFNTRVIIDPVELEEMKKADGKWPLFPKTVLELARKHHLAVPGVTIPGPPEFWDRYRDQPSLAIEERSLVADRILYDFAAGELNSEDRAALRFALGDPAGRERLQQEYIKRHPDEWEKLKQLDQQKRARKKQVKP